MKILVMASGAGTTVQAIMDAGVPVHYIVSNVENCGALARARGQTKGYWFPHAAMTTCVDALEPDLVVLAGYMRILPKEFVERFLTVNIHPSLLPDFKGLDTYNRIVGAGEKYGGCTVHWVNEEMDGGEIIAQAKVRVDYLKDDPAKDLQGRVQTVEKALYPAIIDQIRRGMIIPPLKG